LLLYLKAETSGKSHPGLAPATLLLLSPVVITPLYILTVFVVYCISYRKIVRKIGKPYLFMKACWLTRNTLFWVQLLICLFAFPAIIPFLVVNIPIFICGHLFNSYHDKKKWKWQKQKT
jgi:uncharacterized membrane protein YesL